MSYGNLILADNPVLYWPLNDGAGSVAEDLSPNGLDGTYHNDPLRDGDPLRPTATEDVAVFNPGTTVNQGVSLSNFPMPATEWSVEFWLGPAEVVNISGDWIFQYQTVGKNVEAMIGIGNSPTHALRFMYQEGTNNTRYGNRTVPVHTGAGATPATGSGAYVVVTWRSSDGRSQLWVNGRMWGEINVNVGHSHPSGGYLFLNNFSASYGNIGTTRGVRARLHDFAVYGHILSDDQIRKHFAAGMTELSSEVYHQRVFDTVAGEFVFWSTPQAPDLSGSFYPGPGTFGVDTSDFVLVAVVTT